MINVAIKIMTKTAAISTILLSTSKLMTIHRSDNFKIKQKMSTKILTCLKQKKCDITNYWTQMSYLISDLISKDNFFYQQHFYYQQSFANTQSNQFFYFFTFQSFYSSTFQPFYSSTFQSVYSSVSQQHFFPVFWYTQMDYQWFSLFNEFHQQFVVMSMITNNTFSFKIKNIGFFDFNSNVT